MGIHSTATGDLGYLCGTIHNVLLWAQVSLQEEVSVAGIPNTVADTSEPSLMYLDDWNSNELLRRM